MMFELPLFPLNSVLFPGMPLYLHIFEERYKRMIRLNIDTRQPFGVVLIRRGLEALGPLAEPYRIGCLARIVNMQTLSEGRMNITALGEERFQVISLSKDAAPFLIGNVEPYPLFNREPLAFAQAVKGLQRLVENYLRLLAESGNAQVGIDELPGDPTAFVYSSAGLLQVSPAVKQELLSFQEAFDLVSRLRSIYLREIALTRAILTRGASGEMRVFSRN